MRLLEIKHKIEQLLTEDTIQVQVEQQYNGHAQAILQSQDLFTVLEFLSKQPWNEADFSPIQNIIDKYGALNAKQITVDQPEYDQVMTFVNHINQRLPVFLGIVRTVVKDETPEDFSIKLAEAINSPAKLQSLIKEIVELEKFSNIDGKGVGFVGFEQGSNWIVLSTATSLAYGFIMACLKLAQEILKTKEQYFKTESAKLGYLASLRKSKNLEFSEKGFKDYQESYTDAQLEAGAQKIAETIGNVNGHSIGDIQPKAINTTKSLINIIGNGNEVHLSLNSPKEISESAGGQINMDYSYLSDLAEQSETKQIESSKKKQDPAGGKV